MTTNELRLVPVRPPGPTIAIPATHDQRSDDEQHQFRLRLTEEDARTREAMRELVAARARDADFLASFGGRPLGRCVVELLTAPEHVSPIEHTCELVLRKKLPAVSPEKDPSDGKPGERPLAQDPNLPRAIAHFAELSRRLLADRSEELSRRSRGTPSRIHRSALTSTDPGHGWPRQVSHSRSSPIKIMPLPAGADLGSCLAGVSVEPGQEAKS